MSNVINILRQKIYFFILVNVAIWLFEMLFIDKLGGGGVKSEKLFVILIRIKKN